MIGITIANQANFLKLCVPFRQAMVTLYQTFWTGKLYLLPEATADGAILRQFQMFATNSRTTKVDLIAKHILHLLDHPTALRGFDDVKRELRNFKRAYDKCCNGISGCGEDNRTNIDYINYDSGKVRYIGVVDGEIVKGNNNFLWGKL